MIETSNILGLFPVPILYDYESGYEFSPEELSYINSYETFKADNQKNTLSNGTRVLEHSVMQNMKTFLQNYLDRYTKEILQINQEFYITHTWFTKNYPGDSHHRHNHPDSIISGLLYVNAGPDMGNLNIYRHDYTNTITKDFNFVYDYSDFNLFNSEFWWLRVKTGTVILFPSNLYHSVSENKTDQTRISLGFNSFVRGRFGSDDQFTDLLIN